MTAISQALAIAFQHHQAGRQEAAEQIYRRILASDPAQADAWHLLGVLAHQRGQFDTASDYIGRAIRAKGDVSAFHNNLGEALRAAGKPAEAVACYQRALDLQGNFAEAHSNLGSAYQDLGHFAQAVASYRRALELRPDYAEAQFNLGSTLREQGHWDEAVGWLERAVALRPDFVEAQSKLAEVLVELGQLPAAEAAFRRALRWQPQYAPALCGLAMLLRGELPAADLDALESQLAAGELGEGTRAELLFAVAHVLDGRGDHSRAAASLGEANALRLNLAPRRYDPAAHEKLVDGLLRAFDRELFARVAGMGLETPQPVFVFGLPRSGTTLVEQILASHSQVRGAGELQLARRSFESLPAVLQRSATPLECVSRLDSQSLGQLAAQHLGWFRAAGNEHALRIVDKMPENYLYLGLLAAMFPRATFIHCRRDLRDVAVSCWMTDFKIVPWANDPQHIAARFQQYGRLMNHWRAVLPVPIHDVSYEETVTDLQGVARRLVSACGLEWEPACLEFHRTVRPVRTASASQVRRPVYRQSIGRWRHYEFALAEMLRDITDWQAGSGES